VAQLEHIAQQDQAIDAVQRLQERGAQLGAAQDVDAAARTQVQVGEDERAHRAAL
jgi:hypothetical protein